MSAAIYKHIIRSYFSKDTNVFVRMPSQKVVLGRSNTTGHRCCICSGEIRGMSVHCECDLMHAMNSRNKKCSRMAHPNCVWKQQTYFRFSPELTVY